MVPGFGKEQFLDQQMHQGIFGSLLGIGSSLLGGALGKKNEREANERQTQFEADTLFKRDQNAFEGRNPNFEQNAAFKRRLLGNLANSFTDSRIGAGAPGSAGSFNLRRFDPSKLFAAIDQGGFGQNLRDTSLNDIVRPDFTAPQAPQGQGGFLSDLLGAGLGALGGASRTGFGQNPFDDDVPQRANSFSGFGG